jgi:P27 family predicted phage terminase small subunit
MPGGRPKKLKELKEAHGTLRDDRQIRSIVPAAVSEVPSLPKGVELDDMAMNVWIDTSKKLAPFSALKETDLYTLAAFCDATSRYWQASEEVRKHGLIVTSETGATKKNPAIDAQSAAWTQMVKGWALFGLSPVDRQNIPNEAPEVDGDEWL